MNERYTLNAQLAQMLKGGVIMDVTNPEQARIAEAAGACAVMALEKIPADIRAAGGVARMSDPKLIKEIQNAVSIPVMAKCRIGHFVEAQILEALAGTFQPAQAGTSFPPRIRLPRDYGQSQSIYHTPCHIPPAFRNRIPWNTWHHTFYRPVPVPYPST